MGVKLGYRQAKGKGRGLRSPKPALGSMMRSMPKRFSLPTASRRQVSTAMIILVMVLAVVYLTEFRINAPTDGAPESMQGFRDTCVKAARHANGGGDLVMDDATEEKIGAYCGCVSDAVAANVPTPEIARIAQGQTSDATLSLLDRIVDGCKPKLAP